MHILALTTLVMLVAACGASHVAVPAEQPVTPAPVQAEPMSPEPMSPEPAPSPTPELEPAPDEWPITLHNKSKRPITIVTTGCNGEPAWFTLSHNNQPLKLHSSCFCDALHQGRCLARPAACARTQYETLKPNAKVTHRWNASQLVSDPEIGCSRSEKLPASLTVDVEVCWLDELPKQESGQDPQEYCTKARRTLRDPAGVTLVVAH